MLSSIVLIQLLPSTDFGNTEDAGVHLKLKRIHDMVILTPVLNCDPHTTHGAGPGILIMTCQLSSVSPHMATETSGE